MYPRSKMVETLLDQEIDTKFLVDKNLTMTPNGSLYTRKKQGFLPTYGENV